jgi:hypothetical protein
MSNRNRSNLVDGKGNVVDSIIPIFGTPVLEMADIVAYDGRFGKSAPAVKITVPMNLVGGNTAKIAKTLYASLDSDGCVKIDASLPKGFSVDPAIREEFKALVNGTISEWPLYGRMMESAHKALTAPVKVKREKGEKSSAALKWQPPAKAETDTTATA